MFHGEFESLKAIANTETVKVPKPIKVTGIDISIFKHWGRVFKTSSLTIPFLHLFGTFRSHDYY